MICKTKAEFLKQNTCEFCKGTGERIIDRSVVKCECIKSWEKQFRIKLACTKAGLSDSDLDYDIDTFYGSQDLPNAAKAFIGDFKNTYASHNIYFHGEVNTQKSTLARFISRELIKKGLKVRYVLMDDLIKTLTKTLDHKELVKEDALDKVALLMQADLLVLDESFDKERITLFQSGYQLPYLTSFLKERLEVIKKSTIFVSNIAPRGIVNEGFTAALQSLVIRESFTMEFKDSLDKKHAVKSSNFLDIFK